MRAAAKWAAQQHAAARSWAAGQLGTPADVEPPAARRAFCVLLAEQSFAPEPGPLDALELLDGWDPQQLGPWMSDHFADSDESGLQVAVEGFVAGYFDLAPPQRRAAWLDLSRRSSDYPRLRAWLKRLEPGLGVELPRPHGVAEGAEQVATWCGELFLLGPRQRSLRKRELLTQWSGEPSGAPSAAAELLSRAPEIAALAPDLIAELRDSARLRRRRAMNRQRLAAAASPPSGLRRWLTANSPLTWSLAVFIGITVYNEAVKLLPADWKRDSPRLRGSSVDGPADLNSAEIALVRDRIAAVTACRESGQTMPKELKAKIERLTTERLLSHPHPQDLLIGLVKRGRVVMIEATAEQTKLLQNRLGSGCLDLAVVLPPSSASVPAPQIDDPQVRLGAQVFSAMQQRKGRIKRGELPADAKSAIFKIKGSQLLAAPDPDAVLAQLLERGIVAVVATPQECEQLQQRIDPLLWIQVVEEAVSAPVEVEPPAEAAP